MTKAIERAVGPSRKDHLQNFINEPNPKNGHPPRFTPVHARAFCGRPAFHPKWPTSFRYTIQVRMARGNILSKLCAAAFLITGAIHMNAATKIVHADFGTTRDGAAIRIYTLTNQKGVEARIMNYGGIIVSIKTPDRTGTPADIVLGFDSLAGYLANPSPFFGALVGRYANRIAHAKFTLDGTEYKLEKNDGENTLHGGTHGLDKAIWTPRELSDGGLELTVTSKDG